MFQIDTLLTLKSKVAEAENSGNCLREFELCLLGL